MEKKRRQPGLLMEFLTAEQIAALMEAADAPLPPREQRIIEGEGTDAAGVWVGLPEDRKSD